MIQKELLTSVLQKSCLRSSHSQMFFKIVVPRNFPISTEKHLSWSIDKVVDLRACKEAPTQVFSCEYCKIVMNIFFLKNTPVGCFFCFKKFVNFPVKHQWRRPNTFIYLFNKYDWIR